MHDRESDDDYGGLVAQLSPKWRVIACKHSIQWILQRRKGRGWQAECFCLTRDALLRNIREKGAGATPAMLQALACLPERFAAPTPVSGSPGPIQEDDR